MDDAPEIPASLRLLNAAKLGRLHKSKRKAKQFVRSIPVDRIQQNQFRATLEGRAKQALRNRDWPRLERIARMLSTFDPDKSREGDL